MYIFGKMFPRKRAKGLKQRYHSGGVVGLSPDERPVILQRGYDISAERAKRILAPNENPPPTGARPTGPFTPPPPPHAGSGQIPPKPPPIPEVRADDYASLWTTLVAAYDQAKNGKGKERHANNLPFEEQRMLAISRLLKSERGLAYQACKKVAEGLDLPTFRQQKAELLGAINYIAGIIIYLEEQENGNKVSG